MHWWNDCQTGVPVVTSVHSKKSDEVDVSRVVSILQAADVMSVHPGRKHSKFPRVSSNPLKSLNRKKLKTWMKQKKKDILKYSIARGEGNQSDSNASDSSDDSDDPDGSDDSDDSEASDDPNDSDVSDQ